MAISSVRAADQTVRIFDNFYSTKLVVPASEYDVVFSFFKGTSKSIIIAENFTSLLFRIAQEGGYSVLSLLEILKGINNELELNKVMCYYLNTFRPRASLYGVGIVPKPNQAVLRNVVL
jgi:hypothetical protein